MTHLSVILPTFNNASHLRKHVPGLRAFLDTLGVTYEILVCDDGSRTREDIAAVCRVLDCQHLRLTRNAGKGAAVRAGMLAAKGRFLIFTDNDIPFQYESFRHFLHYLDAKGFDIVCGDRTLPGALYLEEISLARRLGSRLFSSLIGLFVAGGWLDTQCGMKGFRTETARDLFNVSLINRFAFDAELLFIALRRGYDIKRLPVRLRVQEPSGINVLRDGTAMLRDLARVLYYNARGRYVARTPIVSGFSRFLAETQGEDKSTEIRRRLSGIK